MAATGEDEGGLRKALQQLLDAANDPAKNLSDRALCHFEAGMAHSGAGFSEIALQQLSLSRETFLRAADEMEGNEVSCESIRHPESFYSSAYYQACWFRVLLMEAMNLDQDTILESFEELSRLQPNGEHLAEYALFLHRRKRDIPAASLAFEAAIQAHPSHPTIRLKYAAFLRHVVRDVKAAEEQYRAAVDAGRDNPDALGSYATFLHGVHRRLEEAEVLYEDAVRLDDTHANNLCNYGLFLSEERKNFTRAESLYRRVLELSPKHANTLYNYGILLDSHLGRKEEAEELYRRTIAIEPRHSYALFNIAVLLEERWCGATAVLSSTTNENSSVSSEKLSEVESFFRRAAEANPRDPTSLAEYGRYLFVRCNNIELSEAVLSAALKIDRNCDVALYHLALLCMWRKKDYDTADTLLGILIQANPKHSNGRTAIARSARDRVTMSKPVSAEKIDDALKKYDIALQLAKDPIHLSVEYLTLALKYGTTTQKDSARRLVNDLMLKNTPQNPKDLTDCKQLLQQLTS